MEQSHVEQTRPRRHFVSRGGLDALRAALQNNDATSEGSGDRPVNLTNKKINRAEAILEGRLKQREIENERPKTELERIQINQAILKKYEARYTTKPTFIGFNENNHAMWEVKTFVKGYEDKPAPL